MDQMATKEQIDGFHQFALKRLAKGGSEMTIDELYDQWRLENLSDKEQIEVHEAIRVGIREADDGLGRPAEEFIDDMRAKHNISDA